VGARQLEAGDREPPAHAARANDELVSLKTQPGLGDDGVRIDEARSAGMLVDDHSQRINLLPQGRMRTHIVDDLAHTRKQSRIVQHRLSHGYAVLTELARLAHQPAGMGKRPHRTGPSLAAMPPNSVLATSVVRAPSSAARRAASTPAGPAPITTTSGIRGFLLLSDAPQLALRP
jgi:hypothetical protein